MNKVTFNKNINTIYIDLDGVLADFDAFVFERMGRTFPHDSGPHDRKMWEFLATVDRLYFQLKPTTYAHQLVDLAKSYCDRVEILTAIPRRTTLPTAEQDKRDWVKKYLGDIPVNIGPYSRDKWKHAKRGDILIDDRHDNIQDWTTVGFGIGIHHVIDKYNETAQKLSDIMGVTVGSVL